jgi:hypothetical protein
MLTQIYGRIIKFILTSNEFLGSNSDCHKKEIIRSNDYQNAMLRGI